MFSPALGRAVRASSSLPLQTPVSSCTLSRVAAQQTLTHRQTHQRRLSSSKASIPPNGNNGANDASAPQQPKQELQKQTAETSAAKVATRKTSSRTSKKKAAEKALKLPHVPPTDHLRESDVKVSSFFSLHRPMSISSNSLFPTVSTSASFDSIFQVRSPNSRKSMMDNIQTLSGGIESLEATLQIHEQNAPEEVSEEIFHLDGLPQVSIDQLMQQFKPFSPPPAPTPLNQTTQPGPSSSPQENTLETPVKQRSWSTAVVVTESTDASGQRTYSATTAPMVEIQVPAAEKNQEMDDVEIRQPFLERMRQRQNTYNRHRENKGQHPDMLAISVKRQRKLKMKKHKYKKLMKRTRLLRRKLDRA